MKNYMLTLLIVFTVQAYGETNSNLKNLDLENVFVISKGYDTNDNVEITFLAKLPSACYRPYQSNLNKINEFHYRLDLTIKLKDISSCKEPIDPEQVLNPIYYTETVTLGELKAGDYRVTYNKAFEQSKVFNVVNAQVGSIDDFLYAPVTNVFIPEMTYFTDDARVILSGIIQSSCVVLYNRNISVTKLGNVFVVTPKANIVPNSVCERVEVPLQQIISLGKIDVEGSYLIHVRSQSGLSVNKVFHIRERHNDQSGRNSK